MKSSSRSGRASVPASHPGGASVPASRPSRRCTASEFRTPGKTLAAADWKSNPPPEGVTVLGRDLEAARCKPGFERTPANPKGIESSSPGLPRPRGYPGSTRGRFSTPTGLRPVRRHWAVCRNPFGVGLIPTSSPRVARSSQPWASLRNPVGIHREDALQKLICAHARSLDWKSSPPPDGVTVLGRDLEETCRTETR